MLYWDDPQLGALDVDVGTNQVATCSMGSSLGLAVMLGQAQTLAAVLAAAAAAAAASWAGLSKPMATPSCW